MKTFILWTGAVILSIFLIWSYISASVHFTREIGNYWDLADKASTLEQKSEYIDKYIEAFENANLSGVYDALFFPTPSNGFDENFKAVKSFQQRLEEIKDMDVSSFEYQTAIQQITAQEQGEASSMLSTLRGSWYKVNYYWLWNPLIVLGIIVLIIALGTVGLSFLDSY